MAITVDHRGDLFPSTERTWIADRLGQGSSGGVHAHLISTHSGPLSGYVSATNETCALRSRGCDDVRAFDMNGDGLIGGLDRGVRLGSWGQCSP